MDHLDLLAVKTKESEEKEEIHKTLPQTFYFQNFYLYFSMRMPYLQHIS